MTDILNKYGTVMPMPNIGKVEEQTPSPNNGEGDKGVIDKVKETASKLNPLNLVDKAGNFALRAVVVIVATGLIMLGFYFMFQSNIKSIAKAVVN